MASKYAEFRFGWPVVVSSAIGIGLGMSPLPFYTIGVFAGPIKAEFGWSQEQVMLALPIFTISAVITSPIVGYLTDKYGPRRIALSSVFLFSLAMMSFALMDGSVAMYLAIWVVLAIVGAGTLPITWTRAVNSWFFEKRGLALGFSLVGTGLFGAFAIHYSAFMIELLGWRWAYVTVGALPLLISLPVALFLFRDASDPKVADRVAEYKKRSARPTVRYGGLSIGKALVDWRFWLLAYAFIPISFAVGGPIPNLPNMMESKGFSSDDAVFLASLIGPAVIVGRVAGGFLLDHLWAPAVAATILSLPALATYFLAQPDLGFFAAGAMIFILGMAAGVEYDLMAYLVSRYFGLLHYAVIYGALYGFFAVGAGFGPYFFGKSFGVTGSYDSILKVASIMFVVGALPLLLLGKYRDYTEPLDEEA